MPSQTGCPPGTAGRPFYSYRPTLGRYRGWTQIHEGLPTDEDVQRSFNQSCTLQEIKKTELLSGNVNIKDKRVDAIVHTGNKKIEIEINSQNKDYLHTRSTAYICNIYQSNASVGDTYNEDTDIIKVNLTWGLGRNNEEMKIFKIMNEKGELYVKNFIIYEINMDYYDKIWYSKN